MDIREKAAYIKGMLKAYKLDDSEPVNALIVAMADLLEDITSDMEDMGEDIETLDDYIEEIDEDLGELEEVIYSGDDCDCGCDYDCDCCDDDFDDFCSCTCPECGDEIVYEDSIDKDDIECPGCAEKAEKKNTK